MPFLTYENFRGKDLRKLNVRGDAKTSRIATNLDLTTGGGYRTRDGLVEVCTLHAQSVGLYAVGGFLRSVVPGGHSIQNEQTPFVLYDPIGDGVAYPLDTIEKVHVAEIMGASALTGVFPYLSIETVTGRIEHHWIRETPFVASTAVSSKIDLPYSPAPALVKHNGRLWSADQVNGAVRFNSIINGPSDWTLEKDAGNLPVLQFATGNRAIHGLGVYNDLLAVFFGDSTQLYEVPANPALHRQRKVLYGPGTTTPNTVQNVLGDLFYFSRGGFRALSIANQIGEFREGDIGAPVQDETKDLSLVQAPIALWSQTRSQYLCAFGSTIEVFTYSTLNKVQGWTKWELPVTVEYMVELEGVLYIRSGDTVYKFDPEADDDYGTDIDFTLRTQSLDLRDPGREKMIETIHLVQSGACSIKFLVDPRNDNTFVSGPNVSGMTSSLDGIGADLITKALAIEFTGTGSWQFDSYSLKYRSLEGP